VGFCVYRRLVFNILPTKKERDGNTKLNILICISIIYTTISPWREEIAAVFKVIHTQKNLFCYVALICNLVQEFNGLVSKGPAI
jgi:hypothetical protein